MGDEILVKVPSDAHDTAAVISWHGKPLSNTHKEETLLVEWLVMVVSSTPIGHCDDSHYITGWSLVTRDTAVRCKLYCRAHTGHNKEYSGS